MLAEAVRKAEASLADVRDRTVFASDGIHNIPAFARVVVMYIKSAQGEFNGSRGIDEGTGVAASAATFMGAICVGVAEATRHQNVPKVLIASEDYERTLI